MRKQLAAVGLTAGLAVGGAVGFAFTNGTAAVGAQGDTTTTAPASPKGERPDRGARIQEILKPLVDDGTLNQAQADKVAEALLAARPEGGSDRDGHRGPGGKGAFGFGRGAGLDAAAKALGISTDELKAALEDGSSIKDIAADQGVDLSKVTDALVAEATTRINEQVTNGKLTQDQADERIAALRDRITAMVNGEFPTGGRGGFGHRPRGGAPGTPGDDAPGTPTTTEG